jgi:hypothetical protein
MGKTSEYPRYEVVSVRVSAEEKAQIEHAQGLGFTPDNMRALLLFGARCVSGNPPIPPHKVIVCEVACQEAR